MYATITSKGQITLPKALRDALGLKAGDKIALTPDGAGGLKVSPRKTGTLADLFGCLPMKVKPVTQEGIDEAIATHVRKKFKGLQ